MKFNLRLGWLLLLFGVPALVRGQFAFTTNNGAITITGYTGLGGQVTIPSTINGLPVTDIGAWAFQSSGLTAVTITNGLSSIGDDAFWNCVSLASLAIPASVTNIGSGALLDCDSLTNIAVDSANSCFGSLDGVLFDRGLKTLLQCPGGKEGSYSIPDGVTNIGDWGFYGCTGLTNVAIPSSVRSIGYDAFYFCTGLTNIILPDSLTIIGGDAFQSCENLRTVSIGSNVVVIGDGAFSHCLGLMQVTIPDGVGSIGGGAFEWCVNLTNVTIPNSVTNIGPAAFSPCYSLTSIDVGASNPSYCSLDGVLFNRNETTVIACPGAKAGSYTIPEGVKSVGYEAFAFCTNLTSVVVPASVTNIGSQAFVYATGLTGVCFQGNAPRLSRPVVFYPNTNVAVYYLPGTAGWDSTYAGQPAVFWFLPNPLILSCAGLGIQSNRFGFIISWATSASVVVEASTELGKPHWSALQTNALINGSSYFSDAEWTNYSSRFYRVRSP